MQSKYEANLQMEGEKKQGFQEDASTSPIYLDNLEAAASMTTPQR